jgi:hypothetical protein
MASVQIANRRRQHQDVAWRLEVAQNEFPHAFPRRRRKLDGSAGEAREALEATSATGLPRPWTLKPDID